MIILRYIDAMTWEQFAIFFVMFFMFTYTILVLFSKFIERYK